MIDLPVLTDPSRGLTCADIFRYLWHTIASFMRNIKLLFSYLVRLPSTIATVFFLSVRPSWELVKMLGEYMAEEHVRPVMVVKYSILLSVYMLPFFALLTTCCIPLQIRGFRVFIIYIYGIHATGHAFAVVSETINMVLTFTNFGTLLSEKWLQLLEMPFVTLAICFVLKHLFTYPPTSKFTGELDLETLVEDGHDGVDEYDGDSNGLEWVRLI